MNSKPYDYELDLLEDNARSRTEQLTSRRNILACAWGASALLNLSDAIYNYMPSELHDAGIVAVNAVAVGTLLVQDKLSDARNDLRWLTTD